MNKLEFDLKQIPLFRSLPEGEIDSLVRALQPLSLDPGAVLFQEGDAGDTFYLIQQGEVDIIKSMGAGDEQIIDHRQAGDFFGEMSLLLPDGRRTASVRARSPVQLMALNRADFERLMDKRPSLALTMVRELSLRLRDSDDAMIRDLKEKNRELAQAYRELQEAQENLLEKERMEYELELARDIQESILPADLALLKGFDFGARMLPARMVGGDLYDMIQLDEDSVGISIGDVSDKGVAAAIFMSIFCSVLRAEAPHMDSPAEALLRVNQHLLELNDAGMFVTALYGVLNRRSRTFSYARAGHHTPLLYDSAGKEIPIPLDHGQMLGFFSRPELDTQTIDIPPGSTLLLYTDGMFDIMDENQETFGEQRLREMASTFREYSAQEVCDRIVDSLKAYQGDNTQFDDMTLVAVRCCVDPDSD